MSTTTTDLQALRSIATAMRADPIRNYALPGLTSSLLANGKVRLFESDRDTEEHITPHSHRFNFTCLVLAGSVINQIYTEDAGVLSNRYRLSVIEPVSGGLGAYARSKAGAAVRGFKRTDTVYAAGSTYSMDAEAIHSIKFSKGCVVLFFEGPPVKASSVVLEPASGDEAVETFLTQPWMFTRA